MDVMVDNIKGIPWSTEDEGVNYPLQARQFVWAEERDQDPVLKFDDIYIVWFVKTLQNWKALVATSRPDGKYFEVTHNGAKKETYVDTYVKVQNTKYSLEGEPNA